MPTTQKPGMIGFGPFEADLYTRELCKNGLKLKLQEQPFQVLAMLLERPGELVTREEIRAKLWPEDTFVDFDHGLNAAVRRLREALNDNAGRPKFVETLPRRGYRFIAPVSLIEPAQPAKITPDVPAASPPRRRALGWYVVAAICVALVFGGLAIYRPWHHAEEVTYTQLTDFTDSAVAPAISPDGHMVAFIRGSQAFLSSDQIYVKMLPNGEARRVTNDDRPKYGLAFSPDGSEIAYSVLGMSGFSTYEVSVLGGEPQLLLKNAAGLVWLDSQRLLFSEIRSGVHMGVVTAALTRAGLRQIYFPAHERAMAHYSFPSPDRRWALVVEMNGNGDWASCKLVSLDGQSHPRSIGPVGACTSAGWSPDGRWMYFTASVKGQSHIWRQHFPEGEPEQITFGPTEEDGLAVEPEGKALITSVGVNESAIWLHDKSGDRQLSSEGEVVSWPSSPVFNPDASILYYLLRRDGSNAELWRTLVDLGKNEAVFPGIKMIDFDLSPDGKQVVYTTPGPGGTTQLWLAPVDRNSTATRLDVSGAQLPHFGPRGQILFLHTEGNSNYLEQINRDGSNRSKVFRYPIMQFQSVSPGRRWVIVALPRTQGRSFPAAIMAIPLDGGAPRRICASYCIPRWSTDGKFLFVPVEESSRTTPGRSLAIPVGPRESLPDLPAGGIPPLAEPSLVQGAKLVRRAELVPGKDPDHYAWVSTTVHRNLYRISLP